MSSQTTFPVFKQLADDLHRSHSQASSQQLPTAALSNSGPAMFTTDPKVRIPALQNTSATADPAQQGVSKHPPFNTGSHNNQYKESHYSLLHQHFPLCEKFTVENWQSLELQSP